MAEKKWVPFDAVDPYSSSRLYGREKYSLNNMLLREVNFPAMFLPEEDKVYSIWSDRVYHEWSEAFRLVQGQSSCSGDAMFAGMSDAALMTFASKLVGLVENSQRFHDRAEELLKEWEPNVPPREADNYYNVKAEHSRLSLIQAAEEIQPVELTGAAVIRFTHQASGFPCLLFLGIKMCDTPRRMGLPRVQRFTQTTYDKFGLPYEYEFRD
jgi:hypothetical protein